MGILSRSGWRGEGPRGDVYVLGGCMIQFIARMNKRKIEINDIKKQTLRGKKHKTITTKYEAALSYFKNKDVRKLKVFIIDFESLILDLLEQLTSAELIYKLEHSLQEDLHAVQVGQNIMRVSGPYLKCISKEYPIDEIVECFSVKKDPKIKRLTLQIQHNKLMIFFKQLRSIYPEFCFCVGQKSIIEDFDLKEFYETFKAEWGKIYERGRMTNSQKVVIQICRSFYFIGALVENNIFKEELAKAERAKNEDRSAADQTKSEKKKNVKGITYATSYPLSSTYSFASNDIASTFSQKMKSQRSNEEDFSKTGGYSESSAKGIPRHRSLLWQRAEIGTLRMSLQPERPNAVNSQQQVEVDLLSNDVENILIQQAFKIRKLQDAWERNSRYGSMSPYQSYQNYYHYPYYYQTGFQDYYQQPTFMTEEQPRRSFNFTNLVEVRKTSSRLCGNKYS